MLIQILAHTPTWVFVLFGALVLLGGKQLVPNTTSLTRVAIMPIAMAAFSLYGVLSAFAATPLAMLGWAVAAAVLGLVVSRMPLPASTRYAAATRTFHAAGSPIPLALMMGIFFTKYIVGVTSAMHPELPTHLGFALSIGTLYGAFSGIFAARALRLWKLALRQDASLGNGQVA
ncbi:MAG: DUF6622 family protein [Pseudomonadota bacterium]